MECEQLKNRRVRLGYVAGKPTYIQLVDSYGAQQFDLLPIVQAGETDTSIALLPETRRIRYYPEKYTRTEGKDGCYYDICIEDIANLIYLNDLADVNAPAPATGQTIVYNAETGMYELFSLSGAIANIENTISALTQRVASLEAAVNAIYNRLDNHETRINELNELYAALNSRLTAIENAIYNWSTDKNTAIPRGTINITSGGPTSDWIIQSRAKNQNNDLNFE